MYHTKRPLNLNFDECMTQNGSQTSTLTNVWHRLGTDLGTDLSTDQGTDLSTDQRTDLGTNLAAFEIFIFFEPQKPEGIHLQK